MPNDIWFFAPSLKRYDTPELSQSCDCYFRSVSVTGNSCALLCDHCQASILKEMSAAVTPEELLSTASDLRDSGARGLLISGGSDERGVVPLTGFLEAMSEIRKRFGLKVIVHTGLVDEELAAGLASAGVDAAMLDMIGDDETVERICHLDNITVTDYERSLVNLTRAGVPTAPHIVIGLHRGRIRGEHKALEIISRYPVSSLVLVGLVPRYGTAMAGITPPSPQEMGEIFVAARSMMPQTPILLGCERPWGKHKELTDRLALEAGLDGIAYPAEGTIAAAAGMGLEPRKSEMCCALLFQDLMETSR